MFEKSLSDNLDINPVAVQKLVEHKKRFTGTNISYEDYSETGLLKFKSGEFLWEFEYDGNLLQSYRKLRKKWVCMLELYCFTAEYSFM